MPGTGLSRLSHRLRGPCRTRGISLDLSWTLTCGYGLWRTGWTPRSDLRITRLGVRVPPSAPLHRRSGPKRLDPQDAHTRSIPGPSMSRMAPGPATCSTSCVPAGRPAGVDLVGERGHPVVGQNVLQRFPHDLGRVVRGGDRDQDTRPVDGETLSAHAARAQHNRPPARLAMKAHRCHHLAAKPIRAAVRFDLMAHLDGSVHGVRRRSCQNAAVVKQHCGRAVMVVVGEARINEFPAGRDGGVKICFLHGTILGRPAIAGADPPGGQATMRSSGRLPVVQDEEARPLRPCPAGCQDTSGTNATALHQVPPRSGSGRGCLIRKRPAHQPAPTSSLAGYMRDHDRPLQSARMRLSRSAAMRQARSARS